MILPDFLCIGVQRAGTTWLYQMLLRHPEIFMSAQKELHFFDEKPDLSSYKGLGSPGQPFYYDMNSPAHWRWYSRQFQEGKKLKIKGEITPYYATLSARRVALIAERIPRLRIVYILRNPVRRAWSGFRLVLRNEGINIGRRLETDLIYKTVIHPAKLVHGNYKRNIGIWENCFGVDRMLYLFYDDIVQNPWDVLDKVFRFLGVDPDQCVPSTISERINTAPELEMPVLIEEALVDYYKDQLKYIVTRFGRIMMY